MPELGKMTVLVAGDAAPLDSELLQAERRVAQSADKMKASLGGIDSMFVSIADSADKMTTSITAGFERVTTISGKLREEQGLVASAYDRTATAAKAAGDAGVRAGEGATAGAKDAAAAQKDVQVQYDRTAAAARASADAQARGSAVAASSATSAGRAAENAAKRSELAFGASSSAMTKWGGRIALGLAAGVVGAEDLAVKFQGLTTLLNTQAGAGVAHVKQLSAGILKMSYEVGQSPNHLAEAMYHVVSAMNKVIPPTQQVSKELEVQRAAAEGAAIGHSNLDQTTYALSSAMMSLGATNHSAYETMASLNAIVGVGDMRMQEFMTSLRSGVIPSATNFGVSLKSMGAALAYLTDRGMPAVVAATRLRMAMTMMGAPTKQAAAELEAVGMSAGTVHAASAAMSEALEKSGVRVTKLAADMRQPDGIQVALVDLMEHLKAAGLNSEAAGALLARAFGGARSGSAIMTLVQHLDQLKQTYDAVNKQQSSFGHDWSHTQETLQFQLKQIIAGAESLGVTLGTMLIPPTETLIGDLKSTAEWFDHNHAALQVLGAAVGTFALVTIGSYFTSKIKGAIALMQEFGRVAAMTGRFMMGGSFSSTGPTAGAGAATAGVAGTAARAETMFGIGGARSGFGLPGSMANPIITAMIDGQIAGLGSNAAGAAGRATTALRQGETVTSGGVVLPPGVRAPEVIAASEAAARTEATSLSKTLMGALKTGFTSLLRGGMVAGTGLLAANIAGSMIGGKAGSAVSSYGSAAAIGAGIGSVIEPGIGTAIGAALGPVALGLDKLLKGESKGESIANVAAKGMGENAEKALQEGIDKANKQASETYRHIQEEGTTGLEKWSDNLSHTLHNLTGGIIAENQGPGQITNAQRHEVEERRNAELYSTGKQFGTAMISQELNVTQGMSGVAQITAVIQDVEKRFQKLPVAAQHGAFESIMAIVKEFEKDGKLPPTSVEEVIHTIEGKFPALKQSFSVAGVDAVHALNQTLKGQEVLSSAENIVNQWRNVFPQLPKIVGLNMSNAAKEFRKVNTELLGLAHTGPESQRLAATEAYKQMKSEEVRYFKTMRGGIENEVKSISSFMKTHAYEGPGALITAFERMRQTIEAEVAAGVRSAAKGTGEINTILGKELKALGLKTPSELNKSPGGGFGPQPGSGGTGGGSQLMEGAMGGVGGFTGIEGHARGGFVGQQGEAGGDTEHIMAAKGEAVINRHQIPYVQMGLKSIGMSGGLPELFNRVQTPHAFAQGGVIGGPAELAAMMAEANRISSEHLPYAWGGGHGTAGVPSVGSASSSGGPAVRGYDCSGSVSAVLHAGGLLARPEVSGELMNWGLPGPGAVTVYANPIHTFMSLDGRFFGTHGADGAGWYAGSALPGFVQRHAPGVGPGATFGSIPTPKAGAHGTLHAITQAILRKETAGANKMLSGALSKMTAGGAGGGGDWGTMPHGDIMKIAEFAAKADGVPWEPNLVRTLLSKESGGGQNLAPHNFGGGLDPAGPFQVISSTFNAYAKPGHHNRMNPVDNALAAFAYIKSRYGTMQALAKATGLLGRGYKGYAGGGQIGKGAHGSPAHQAAVQHSKQHLSKGKGRNRHGGHRSKPNTSVRALTAPFRTYPDVEDLPEVASGLESQLSILDQQFSLLGQIEQDPHGAFILEEDMQYLKPTFPPNLQVGWDTMRAKKLNEEAIAHAGEATPELTLQGQLLDWIAAQDTHHLLTAPDMGILGSTLIDGIPIKQGMNILQAEYLNRQFEEGLFKSERTAFEKAMKRIAYAISERESRKSLVETVIARTLSRKKKIEKQLEHLALVAARRRVTKAKHKLSAAEAKAMRDELIFDAETHKDAVTEAIMFEKQKPAKQQDKALLHSLEDESHRISSDIHQLRSPSTSVSSSREAVTTAYEKLLDTQLKQSLKPLDSELSTLGGSTTRIGTGGEIGRIVKDIHGLSAGASKFDAAILQINTQSLPSLALDFRNIQDASEVPIAPTLPKSAGGEGAANEKEQLLKPALEEKLRLVEQENLVLKAQSPVFKELVGAFEVGTTYVPRTGQALVHEGEAIIPRSLNPFVGGSGSIRHGSVPEIHLHGDLADFATRVESVVDGKKRDITTYVNKSLARNAQSRRLLPV